jgi:ABC-type bacteriocin/lantibiotic exporter with double-glycine peptidase domain
MPVTPFSRLRSLLNFEKSAISTLYFYAILSGLISLSLPLGIQSALNFIQSGQITTSWILLVLFVIAGVVLTGILQILQLRITENIQQQLFVHYSFQFAHRFPRFNRMSLKNKVPSELMNRFFDIVSLQKGFSKVLLDFPSALLQILFSLIVLSLYHPLYIAFSLLLITLLFFIFRPILKQGLETSLKESKYKYKTAYWLQEIARADWSFRLIPDEKLSLERLDTHTSNYLKSREKHFSILWKQSFWLIAIKSLVVTALLGLGGYLVIHQQINMGQFVAAEVLILLLLGAVEKIILSMETFYDVCTSLEKLEQIKDIPLTFAENETEETIELFPLELVDMRTNEQKSILTINKNEHVQLIGAEQQKINQLLRAFIDSSVSETYKPRWNYRIPSNHYLTAGFSQIGWASKGTQLFDGTLLENLQIGRENVSVDAVKKALNHVGLGYLFENHPQGLDIKITRGNKFLSEDERERILVARALVHNPNIAILSFVGTSLSDSDLSQLITDIIQYYPNTTLLLANESIILDSINTVEFNALHS